MIYDQTFFAESLMVPSSYMTIFKTMNKKLTERNYAVICNSYKEKLDSSYRTDVPSLKNYNEYNKNDFLRNVIFLKQSHNFGKLAINAVPEVKPLLLYYAENQLNAFFINSLFNFDVPSRNHGLTLTDSRSYENVGIKLAKNGFFPRIINTYTILNAGWVFSPLESTTSNSFQKRSGNYVFFNEPIIKLKELIDIKERCKPHPNGYILDILDYLFLFIASFLARYKPDIWHEIVAGENGNEFVYFKQSFTRFSLVWDRLIDVLYSIQLNANPFLSNMDIEMKDKSYQIQT